MILADMKLSKPFQEGFVERGEYNICSRTGRFSGNFIFTIDRDDMPEKISPLEKYNISVGDDVLTFIIINIKFTPDEYEVYCELCQE